MKKETRTDMTARICNCSRTVGKYIRHLDSCDISDTSDNSHSRLEQTCLQVAQAGKVSKLEFKIGSYLLQNLEGTGAFIMYLCCLKLFIILKPTQ